MDICVCGVCESICDEGGIVYECNWVRYNDCIKGSFWK